MFIIHTEKPKANSSAPKVTAVTFPKVKVIKHNHGAGFTRYSKNVNRKVLAKHLS